jgi:predicted Zn-dependent protease
MYSRGLIAKAENANEVAGVIAHEIGHVAYRDGTKGVLEGDGLSF